MVEKSLAVMGLVACLLVWAGMALGPVRRQSWAARVRFFAQQWKQRLRRPGRVRAAQREAKREATEAIERARRTPKVGREGNVYRPDRFHQGRDGRDKLH
jgi:hypothetical protein